MVASMKPAAHHVDERPAAESLEVSQAAPERRLEDFLIPDSTDEPVHEVQLQVDWLLQGPADHLSGDLKDIVGADEDDLLLSQGAPAAQGMVRPAGTGEARLGRWNPLGYGLLSYFMAWAPGSDASSQLIDESDDLDVSDGEASSRR